MNLMHSVKSTLSSESMRLSVRVSERASERERECVLFKAEDLFFLLIDCMFSFHSIKCSRIHKGFVKMIKIIQKSRRKPFIKIFIFLCSRNKRNKSMYYNISSLKRLKIKQIN